MTHVMAPDERRRRLASGADLHASERYDGVQPCSDQCRQFEVHTASDRQPLIYLLQNAYLCASSLCQFTSIK